jgi:hypothetical protein
VEVCSTIPFNDLDASNTQGRRWITSDPPPLRVAHAKAYHAASFLLYNFGGRAWITMQEQAMQNLWKLDCSDPGSKKWLQVQFHGEVPEAQSFT